MTLRDYGRVVVRRKWIVVAPVLLAAVVSVLLTAMQTPIYSASAEVLIQPRGEDALFESDVRNLNDRSIQTEIQVVEGVAVRDRVRENLGLADEPPPVSAAAVGGTDVIRLSVRDPNASNAATYADAYAQAYIQVRREQSVEALLAASTEVQNAIDQLQAQIDSLPDDDPQVASLRSQQANFNTTLDQLRVDAALRTGGAVVIRTADVPASPIEPTPGRTLVLAAVVGLLIGLASAFLIEYLDDKVRTAEDLEDLTAETVLAAVPVDPPPDSRPVALSEPTHGSVEAYRGLRTNLQFLALDRPLNVVQITSSLPGEGKTTTATNLAVVLAHAGHRVALVDADLRRPTAHLVFSLDQKPGLSELLLGAEPRAAVNHVDVGGGDRMSVYTAGTLPSNPSEMLSSKRIRVLLGEMGAHYDYVIVDSAPILPVSDSVALAAAADGVIVVAHSGRVTETNVDETMERLARVSAPTLGFVLNQVTARSAGEYLYGGYEAAADIAEPVAGHVSVDA